MYTKITWNQGTEILDITASTESTFYKVIAEKISSLPIPNTVFVETNDGIAKYSIEQRSGTILIKEVSNTIDLPEGSYNKCYLVYVNAEKNNYKFYQLEQTQPGEVLATYGRIGAAKGEQYGARSYAYPSRMFWVKYMEKIAKGYVDKSDIYLTSNKDNNNKTKTATDFSVITNNNASEYLFRRLHEFAKKQIEETCVDSNITIDMVKESKKILNIMYKRKRVSAFNNHLVKLLAISPRKVTRVSDLLAESTDDFAKIIDREENLILAMEALVLSSDRSSAKANTFDMYDTEVYVATAKQKAEVLRHLDQEFHGKVKNIFRVINNSHKKRFNKYLKDSNISTVKQFWHGSRNENWASIVINGLQLNPNAIITGKMFGNGIYFANTSKKSWNYTSFRGTYWAKGTSDTAFMGLYATAYGTPLDVHCSKAYTQSMLDAANANCVHAHKGVQLLNDEIIYYSEDAMLLNYIVEFE